MTDKTDGQQKPHLWKRGQSGNPKGRPAGSRHRATLAVEALLEGEAEALTRTAVEVALSGDVTALRLCLDRLAPPRKSRPVMIDLPPIETAEGVLDGFNALVAAVASGDLTPDEGATMAGLLEMKRRALETVDIETRLSALEAKESKR